jgi:uncharacterized OsmC-like protein
MAGVEMRGQLSGITTLLSHGPSGTQLKTVPPRDNGGDASSFSPTDLVGAALASCALTTMALIAKREGMPFGDASARVEKVMGDAPRRIAELTLEVQMPKEVKPEHRARLEEIARGCPVAKSLSAELRMPMKFTY